MLARQALPQGSTYPHPTQPRNVDQTKDLLQSDLIFQARPHSFSAATFPEAQRTHTKKLTHVDNSYSRTVMLLGFIYAISRRKRIKTFEGSKMPSHAGRSFMPDMTTAAHSLAFSIFSSRCVQVTPSSSSRHSMAADSCLLHSAYVSSRRPRFPAMLDRHILPRQLSTNG